MRFLTFIICNLFLTLSYSFRAFPHQALRLRRQMIQREPDDDSEKGRIRDESNSETKQYVYKGDNDVRAVHILYTQDYSIEGLRTFYSKEALEKTNFDKTNKSDSSDSEASFDSLFSAVQRNF